jgi:hypothetical protein
MDMEGKSELRACPVRHFTQHSIVKHKPTSQDIKLAWKEKRATNETSKMRSEVLREVNIFETVSAVA